MDGSERAERICGQAKRRAKFAPVGSGEYVGVFDQYDALAAARVTRAKKWFEVVNGGKVRGHKCVVGVTQRVRKGEVRPDLVHVMHGARQEIVQRDDTRDDRRKRHGNPWIAVVGNVQIAFDLKLSNVGLKRFLNLGGGAGKINDHAARIDHVDPEPLCLKPTDDSVQILLRHSVLLPELLR